MSRLRSIPCLVALLCASPAFGGTFAVVHTFDGADGSNPSGPLATAGGRLVGTTLYGPANGTAFELAKSGELTVLHAFSAPGDGADPFSNLTEVNGVLYGTTSSGGSNSQGTIFSVTPDGRETVLYSFAGPDDGRFPLSGMVAMDGVLYGATAAGGDSSCNGGSGCGVVYSFDPATGTFRTVHRLSDDTGWFVSANLLPVRGTLYGTAPDGGAHGWGTVFAVKPTGEFKVLYSFTGGADGGNPNGALAVVDGVLYGTASGGGSKGLGVAFSLTTSGTETVLHSFGARGDGSQPTSNLTYLGGKFYGTTSGGGAFSGGTIFSVTKSGQEVVEHSLSHFDGIFPSVGLTAAKGVLYGSAYTGGSDGCGGHGCGTLFSYKP